MYLIYKHVFFFVFVFSISHSYLPRCSLYCAAVTVPSSWEVTFRKNVCFYFVSCLQWISVPFALTNPAVTDITVTAVKQVYQSPWRGSINKNDTWVWIDNFCLLVQHHQQFITCFIRTLS